MSFDLIDAHRRLATEIEATAERAGLLREGDNTQDVGDARERTLSEAISSWFPSTHTLSRGQLVSPSDLTITRPIDIVVANTAEWCPLVKVNNATQFLAEAVRATIEVKSNLTKEEFVNGLEKLGQASHQKRQCRIEPQRFASCLFAYDGPALAATVLGWLPEIAQNWSGKTTNHPYFPNCIIVLQKYALVCHGHVNAAPTPITVWEFAKKDKEFSMLIMHQMLEQRLDLQIGSPLMRLIPSSHSALGAAKTSTSSLPPTFDSTGW